MGKLLQVSENHDLTVENISNPDRNVQLHNKETGRRSYDERILFNHATNYEPASKTKRIAHAALSLLLSAILAIQPVMFDLARAQVISDPKAPLQFRPNVTTSGNGTPLVNIVTPSFGGVSHNKFQNYDIDTRGVILNNSSLDGISVIGGSVSGNPNLKGNAPARIIVNEVTGSRASTLNGPTEVFGSKADVVVANPNGISCVSCSFINSGKVTLSTGVPTPDYDTGAITYRTTKGTISIEGAGLSAGSNAPLGNIDLIGRKVEVKGPVTSNGQLRIRTGAINYDQSSDTTTAIAGMPAVSGPSVFSSATGTITAGSISVLSKDVNLGIQLAGDIHALDGYLLVQGAGDLAIANAYAKGDISLQTTGQTSLTGKVQTGGRLTAIANDIQVSSGADLKTADALVLQAANDINSAGKLQSSSDTTLTANGAVTASGSIQANGQIALEGNSVTTNVFSVYGTDVTIIGRSSVELNETAIRADDAIRVMAPNISLGQDTGFKTDGLISIDAKNDFFTDSVLDYPNLVLSVKDNIGIGAHGGLVQDDINFTLTGTLTNLGQIYGRNSTTLSAANLINESGASIYGPDVSLNIAGQIENSGNIIADDTLTAIAASLSNATGGVIYASDANVTVTASFENLGSIVSDESLQIIATGVNIRNNGTLQSNGDIVIEGGAYTADLKTAVLAGNKVTVTLSDTLSNNGRVLALEAIALKAARLVNGSDASIYGYGVTVNAANGLSNAGAILSGENLTIDTAASAIFNSGTMQANGNLSAAASAYTGTATAVVGGDIVVITATGAIDNSGKVTADSLLLMRAASLSNQVGSKIAAFDIGLALSGDISNAGAIQATGLLNLAANNFTNSGQFTAYEISRTDPNNSGSLASGITLTGNLLNSGVIQTTNNLLIETNALTNTSWATIQGKAISLQMPGVLVNNGMLRSDGLLTIKATAGVHNEGNAVTQATMSAKQLQIDAYGGAVNNGPYGLVQGSDSTTIRAANSNFDLLHINGIDQGQFNYGKDLVFILTNQGFDIGTGQSLIVDGTLYLGFSGDVNIMGTLASRGDLALHAGGSIAIGRDDPLNPGGGEVFTRGNAELVAGVNITNTASIIQSLGSMYIEAGGTVTNKRTEQTKVMSMEMNPSYIIDFYGQNSPEKYTDELWIYAETSQAAQIWADGDLVIKADTVTNDASTIYAIGTLAIQAVTINNLTRDTGIYYYTIKTGGSKNIGKIFYEGWWPTTPQQETSSAIIGQTALIMTGVKNYISQGITEGTVVRIDAETLINGIVDPNRFTAPTRIPDPVIDLSRYFDGVNIGSITNPGAPSRVKVGNVTYLHAAPILGGADERGPGWILDQVGDAREDLTFFVDPTTERRLISQALIEQTGSALLDPNYKNPIEQQEALWQGTVDFLESHPDVKLGDTLTAEQRADINEPIIWYHTVNIDGEDVLVPEIVLPEGRLSEWAKTNGGSITGDNIYLSGDYIYNSGSILANQDLTIQAGTFVNEQRVTSIGGTDDYWENWSTDYLQEGGNVSGNKVQIITQGDLYNIGGTIVADSNLSLIAGGDLVIASQTVERHMSDGSKDNGGTIDDYISSGGSVLSGGSATLVAGGDLNVIGSQVKAEDDLTLISITGDVNIVASVDARERSHNDDGKISTDTHITNKGSEIVSGGDLTIISSGGDITLQASHLGGESITLSAEDTIHFATATDQHSHVESGKSSNGLTQTQYNNGRSTEDLVYTTMDIGNGGLTVEAEQIIIDYLSTIKNTTLDKKGEEQLVSMFTQSPQDAINQLINNPGMGWLAQVTNDGSLNITYNGQTITNTEWDHDQTTLTPAAAAVIAVVVSVVTAGVGSAIGAAAGLTVGATSGTASVFTAIGGTIAQGLGLSATGAVAAGIGAGVGAFTSSVISGTLIGAINGDLDMGSVLMNALASGLTAGILQGLNQGVFANSIDNVLANNTNWQNLTAENFLTSIAKVGVNSTVSAGIRTALLGGDFEDNFLDALKYNASNLIVEPIGFNIVGDIIGSNAGSLEAALLHAIIGAAGGYISGGLEGLQGGALGAFLGELVVSGDPSQMSDAAKSNMLAVQQIIGGLASFAVGDASMAGVDAAVNGYIYNFLQNHQSEKLTDLYKKRAACQGAMAECTAEEIRQIDAEIAQVLSETDANAKKLLAACEDKGSPECAYWANELKTSMKRKYDAYLAAQDPDTYGFLVSQNPDMSDDPTLWPSDYESRESALGARVALDDILDRNLDAYLNSDMSYAQMQENIKNDILADARSANRNIGAIATMLNAAGIAATIIATGGAGLAIKLATGVLIVADTAVLATSVQQTIIGEIKEPALVSLLVAGEVDVSTARQIQTALNVAGLAAGSALAAREVLKLLASSRGGAQLIQTSNGELISVPNGYRPLGSVGAAGNDVAGLPTGFTRVIDAEGNIVIAGPRGQIFSSIDDLPVPTGQFSGKYEANPKHDISHPNISPQPTNPETTLANSVPTGANSPARIGYDPVSGEIVVFRQHNSTNDVYHGYAKTWETASQQERNALVAAGWFTAKGRVIK